MSWFGGGKKKTEPMEKGFADTGDFGAASSFDASSSPLGGGGGAGGGMAEFQQFSMAIQQQVLVQQAITDLSDRAFQKCISGNKISDGELSGRDVACIHAVTNKWLDTNQYMIGRLSKKQQQASSSFG